MATRMQQRRGTQSQWASANPILNSGEIGFETDTGKFKIGDGTNHWADLSYFENISSLGGSFDDYIPLTQKGEPLGVAELDANGKLASEQLPDVAQVTVHAVANQEARLALSVEVGDIAIQANNGQSYVLSASPASVDTNWSALTVDVSDLASVSQVNTFTSPNTFSGGVEFTAPVIAADLEVTNTAEVQSLTVNGDLSVLGTTTTVNTQNLSITDPMIYIGEDNQTNNVDLGFVSSFNDGTYQHTGLVRDASDGRWKLFKGVTDEPTTVINFTQGSLDDLAVYTLYAQSLNVGSVSNTEIGYLDGVTSSIQDQLDANSTAISTHENDTTNVHGILDTSQLAVKSDVTDGITSHADTTTNVHGIPDTAALINTTMFDNHLNDTSAHGVAGSVVGTTDIQTLTNKTIDLASNSVAGTIADFNDALSDADFATLAGIENFTNKNIDSQFNTVSVGLSDIRDLPVTGAELMVLSGIEVTTANLNFTGDVTSPIQAQLDGKAASSHIHTQSDITNLTTDLAAKAPLASPTFTGTLTASDVTISGNLTVEGTTTTVNAQDLVVSDPLIYIGEGNTANLVDLGLVSSFNDGTYQHAGIVRDSSAGKWKVFKGVTDEPTTTINFTQGSLDDLAVNNVEVAGVVFSDGTQTKQGVPSITSIAQKTDSYTLGALTERDTIIEINKSTATTLTIPTDATLNFPVGTTLDIIQTGTGQVTIAGASGVTVNATPGLKLRAQWSSATLLKRGANTWLVYGDLSV